MYEVRGYSKPISNYWLSGVSVSESFFFKKCVKSWSTLNLHISPGSVRTIAWKRDKSSHVIASCKQLFLMRIAESLLFQITRNMINSYDHIENHTWIIYGYLVITEYNTICIVIGNFKFCQSVHAMSYPCFRWNSCFRWSKNDWVDIAEDCVALLSSTEMLWHFSASAVCALNFGIVSESCNRNISEE